MSKAKVILLEGVLNSATAGEKLAAVVHAHFAKGELVRLDLHQVKRVTPSFANALLMNLLASHSVELVRSLYAEAPPEAGHIVTDFYRSIDRFVRGIRLSHQRITGLAG